MNYKKILIISTLLAVFLLACKKEARFSFDYKKELVAVEIHRFDKALIELDSTNLSQAVSSIYNDFNPYLKLFVENFDTIPFQDTLAVTKSLNQFVNHPAVSPINKKVLETFQNIDNVEHEVSIAFTYLKHYFPGIALPELFFFTSGLSSDFIYADDMSVIGVGSDFYLGSDFEPYQEYFYDYMIPMMQPTQLSVDLVTTILYAAFQYDSSQNRLIDNMIYRGKILYLLAVIMPERTDKEVIKYTVAQEDWAKKFEQESWLALVGNKHLFSSDKLLVAKYMDDAPFTAPISQDSPGRLGEWLGLQIVKKYMERNRDVSLPNLMQQDDYQYILEKSGYNP